MVLDNFRTIELIWDKANKSIIKTIKTASSDMTGRYFSVKILDGGQEVTLSNAKLQLYWEHPNFNTSGTDDFTKVDNNGLFQLTFSNEMLTNIGELNAHLVLTLSDGKITSDGFKIEVIKGADAGVVVPSQGNGIVKQIEGKIDKGNVTLGDLTQEVKEALTGGAVAVVGVDAVDTVNVKDGAITTSKIADKAINGSKLSSALTKKSYNLFDLDNAIRDGYYRASDGVFVPNSTNVSFGSSDLIPVKPGDALTSFNMGGHVTFWEEDGLTFVRGVSVSGNSYQINAFNDYRIKWARVSFITNNGKEKMFVKGHYDNLPMIEENEGILNVTPLNLSDDLVKEETVNLIDPNALEPGVYYAWNTGKKIAEKDSWSTGLIPITPDTLYSKNIKRGGHLTFWGGDGSDYIGGMEASGKPTFKVPDNPAIKFLRHSIYGSLDTPTIVKGEHLDSNDVVRFNPNDRKLKVTEKNIADKSVGYNQLSDTLRKDIYSTDEKIDMRYIKPFKRVENPVITKDMVTDRIDPTGVADPFIVMDKGRYHMFFEVLGGTNPNTTQVADEIGHAYSDNLINWTYTGIVLSKEIHGHRSAYPHVFKHGGDWYMLPDTNSTIKLYKATNFPLEWELVADLISGQFSDTDIFEIDNVWYLVSMGGVLGRGGTSLYYNTSGSFANDNWQLHPVGLVIENQGDETWTRPGGRPKVFDDYVLLPIQVTKNGVYGRRTYLYKLSNISLTNCDATNLGVLVENGGDGDWTELSMHHVSYADYVNGSVYAVDGQDSSATYSIGLFEDVF